MMRSIVAGAMACVALVAAHAQADKKLYQFTMKHRVEAQERLTLRQEIVEAVLLEDLGKDKSGPRRRVEVRSGVVASCIRRGETSTP